MKSKTWLFWIGGLLLISLGLSLWLLTPGKAAEAVEIRSEGKLLYTLDLSVDQTLTVQSAGGFNEIAVKDGKVAVTHADCPDGYCMERGWCSSGAQIICLPNRLVISFVNRQEIDGVSG